MIYDRAWRPRRQPMAIGQHRPGLGSQPEPALNVTKSCAVVTALCEGQLEQVVKRLIHALAVVSVPRMNGATNGVVAAMILVVEGISASGKTTWCNQHGDGHVVPEHGRFTSVPDRIKDPAAAAAFWAERNVDRWQAARAMEQQAGWAVCDSDPLKLHYIWTLWQIGEASERDWLSELQATRDTIAQGRIGFADRYLVVSIAPELARERAKADTTRRRSNFELHVRLQQAL